MIIFDSYKKLDKKTSILVFSNDKGKKISIPISNEQGDLIISYLRLLSSEPSIEVEKSEDQESEIYG